MSTSPNGRNGTGRAHASLQPPGIVEERWRQRLPQLLVACFAVAVVGVFNALLTNNAMARLENEGSPQYANPGAALNRALPGIFSGTIRDPVQRSQAAQFDPRQRPAYGAEKRALERWLAVALVGISGMLFCWKAYQQYAATRLVPRRPSVMEDMAALFLLLGASYAVLSLFEVP